jgi:hypothetical protein
MKIAALVLAVLMFTGCATHYYVNNQTGVEQSYKSMQECLNAHPDDGGTLCVDRGQYTQATQNTWALILQGLLTAAVVALTIFTMTGGGK